MMYTCFTHPVFLFHQYVEQRLYGWHVLCHCRLSMLAIHGFTEQRDLQIEVVNDSVGGTETYESCRTPHEAHIFVLSRPASSS